MLQMNSPKLLHAQGVSKCLLLICCHGLIHAPENLPNSEHFPHWGQLCFMAMKSTKAFKNTKNLSSQYIGFYYHSLMILFSSMLQTYLLDSSLEFFLDIITVTPPGGRPFRSSPQGLAWRGNTGESSRQGSLGPPPATTTTTPPQADHPHNETGKEVPIY